MTDPPGYPSFGRGEPVPLEEMRRIDRLARGTELTSVADGDAELSDGGLALAPRTQRRRGFWAKIDALVTGSPRATYTVSEVREDGADVPALVTDSDCLTEVTAYEQNDDTGVPVGAKVWCEPGDGEAAWAFTQGGEVPGVPPTASAAPAVPVTGTVNDLTPTAGGAVLPITTTGASTVTGLVPAYVPPAGQYLRQTITNAGPDLLTLAQAGAGSAAGNRFYFPSGQDYPIPPGGAVTLLYDPGKPGWVPEDPTGVTGTLYDGSVLKGGLVTLIGPGPPVSSTGYWNFVAATTASDPGSGKLKFNNAVVASATASYLSDTTSAGTDATQVLSSLRTGDTVYVQDRGNSANWARFTLSGGPTDNGAWFTLPVTHVSSAGSVPSNNSPLVLQLNQQGGGGGGLADPTTAKGE